MKFFFTQNTPKNFDEHFLDDKPVFTSKNQFLNRQKMDQNRPNWAWKCFKQIRLVIIFHLIPILLGLRRKKVFSGILAEIFENFEIF